MEPLGVASAIGPFNQVQAAFSAGILVRHDILVTAGKRCANSVYCLPGSSSKERGDPFFCSYDHLAL